MKTTIQKFILLVFLVIPVLGFAQTHKLTGSVVAFNQFPLKNVTVSAKKSKTEVKTDEQGRFEIEVKKSDVVQVKESVFVEYSKKVTEADESLQINMIIKNNERAMEKVVRDGFISREDLEYGVENLWQWNNEFNQFTDAYDAIKYALPESTIIVENGQKGVQFRGPKTITGSNAALILVNGVITEDADFVTPSDIISIRKLSASQSALFGARAANGVISIETR
ncbi:MAG: carboxypeptidase-like regulatory domain-containing protein [Cyclobacteriaceae bacterium]|nr:carboxypeptidase-like regulatory domain-containing protein [Cyclobacteriaceae bacterium]